MVYCNTEFYQSMPKILGTYTTRKEAISRIESQPNMKTAEVECIWAILEERDTHVAVSHTAISHWEIQ